MVRHLLVALVLIGVAVASGVHYDAMYDQHWPYPTEDELQNDYERYVGEQAFLFGDVERIDRSAQRATIDVETDAGTLILNVEGIYASVEPGGVVQVYGTVEPEHTIDARNIVVVEASPGNRVYKFAVSGVGAMLAIAGFFRFWWIDRSSLQFEPR